MAQPVDGCVKAGLIPVCSRVQPDVPVPKEHSSYPRLHDVIAFPLAFSVLQGMNLLSSVIPLCYGLHQVIDLLTENNLVGIGTGTLRGRLSYNTSQQD